MKKGKIFGQVQRFLPFLVIIILVSLFFDLYLAKKAAQEEPKEVRVMDFPIRQKEFGGAFLKTIVFVGQGSYEEASSHMAKIRDEWRKIEEDFKGNKPRNFRKVKNWPQGLEKIDQGIREAIELQEMGKMSESFDALRVTLGDIEILLNEAELRNMDIELAGFYVLMKDVVASRERSEAMKMMPELKMRFTKMKELDQENEDFQSYLAKIGEAMSRIEMSTPKVFNEFKEDLEPSFLKILE